MTTIGKQIDVAAVAANKAQKEDQLQRMMMAMAKAHDTTVSEREQGAALALRCGNGMATNYWRTIAKAALRNAHLNQGDQ